MLKVVGLVGMSAVEKAALMADHWDFLTADSSVASMVYSSAEMSAEKKDAPMDTKMVVNWVGLTVHQRADQKVVTWEESSAGSTAELWAGVKAAKSAAWKVDLSAASLVLMTDEMMVELMGRLLVGNLAE